MAKKTQKISRQDRNTENKKNGALFIPAGLFIGLGIGFLVNNVVGGTLLGLGAGFLVFAIMTAINRN